LIGNLRAMPRIDQGRADEARDLVASVDARFIEGFDTADLREMAASSGFMIAEAERRFGVRIRVGVPRDGLGSRLDQIKAWVDENAGANGWAMTPSGHEAC
jgi:hypothetical protein